ncbi:transporter substrate-binding domain-containing protein [Shewanella polaris]|uniref:Transporter substrate-binding domain-containing protein n=1 Tax=Shewanella polaris TaxID=2588449 RepID=A0A4Y5YJQ8_9GAMM|nr:transporter substrate-binding domain-containing protein [Shewanella polaris]
MTIPARSKHGAKYLLKYLLVLLSIFSIQAHATPIRIASDIWCPYICENQTGYVVELTRRAFEIQGQSVEFQTIPYKRALVELQKNNIDAVLALTPHTITENQLINADVIVGYKSTDFYTLVGSNETFGKITDLNQSQQIAVVSGYSYGVELDAWFNAHTNTYFATGRDPLAMNIIRLVKGRHSVIVGNKNVIEYTTSQLNLSQQLRYAGTMGKQVPLYVGFNQQNKAGSITFTNGINMLKANGEYQKIISKYKVLPDATSDKASHSNLQKFLPIFN